MLGDTRQIPLGEVAATEPNSFVDGPFGSNLKSSEYTDHGVRLIQLQNIGDGFWIDDNRKFINEAKFRTIQRHGALPGEIAIAKMAEPVARACLLPLVANQFVVVADCIKLHPDADRFDARYVTYVINSWASRTEAERKSTGTTRQRINLSVLKTVHIWAPPLPEQRRIAEILDTLDEAIRKTEQVIAKLQQMKQGLLHDLLTRGIDEHGELRDPERHPEQFKDSALGRIPRGWEVGPLEDWLCGLPRNGYSPKAVDGWTGSMMLGLGCLTPNGFEARQLKNAPRNDAQLQRALLHPGDLLLSRSNTRDLVGLAGVYESIGAPCIYPDLMMRLSPADTTSSRFLEQILRSLQVRRQIQAAASGTSGSMVKISAAIVRRLLVAMPEMHEQGVIIGTLDRATELVDQEKAETLKLRTLKHGLMDDLLTGRVRVSVPKEANP